MAEFHTVGKVSDLAEGEGMTVAVGTKLIAVFRTDGKYFAIDDTCPHMGASLSGGFLENGIVTCPWHAWRFRIHDGAWADNPRIKIGCYPVRVEGERNPGLRLAQRSLGSRQTSGEILMFSKRVRIGLFGTAARSAVVRRVGPARSSRRPSAGRRLGRRSVWKRSPRRSC